jgi:hypothetical protein
MKSAERACVEATLKSVHAKSRVAREGYEAAAKLFAMAWATDGRATLAPAAHKSPRERELRGHGQ